ncbi:helix-turn-helix domain-containing protein [Kibdelosporangium persicum]|uniref:Acetoin dehydrogenase operon transcriptional activator AcoR n=1 Tax=Kibdelosporangium persicum TaxID=2698649 RepID=A0ABX2FHP9_9PSEU|nr:helix-turn-helix domain-containing protein [Kibdelosporangium persicum]NRN70929.1 Acetoin dehydrogenase operon transcriptional activator AcoR [Kibdelosporangium persicum]
MNDASAYAFLVSQLRHGLPDGRPAGEPRALVSASWQRSLAACIDPEHGLPDVVYPENDIPDLRADHPLAPVMPSLRAMLVSIADEAKHIMLITDAAGHVLWREGNASVRRLADKVLLTEGTRWTEDSIGTNAMGTALAVDGPVMIHAEEHLVRRYHPWTCAAAPVHDPDTGVVLGVIDVTGPLSTMHPSTLALVSAAAQLAEGQLRTRMNLHDERFRQRYMRHLAGLRGEPGALVTATGRVVATESCDCLPSRVDVTAEQGRLWLPDGREACIEPLAEGYLLRVAPGRIHRRRQLLTMPFLGVEDPRALLDGQEIALTLRHAEILTLLALHPRGMTAEQLALELYGESGNPVTARAEIHRLRTQLGASAISTKPYRLETDVDADFISIREPLRGRRVREAVAWWRGPLLPRSNAPGVQVEREQTLNQLRRLVLERRDLDALYSFVRGTTDQEALEVLVRGLPPDDSRQTWVQSQLRLCITDE